MSWPQPFGPYDLLERVSVGGMAEIFRARVRASGEIVAVKRILPEVEADREFIEMFVDEGRIAAQLDHPNIVRVLDIGEVDETHYLAMQFVDGLDLRAVFDRAAARDVRLEPGWLAAVFTAVCAGLQYAHERKDAKGRPLGLVHRDVSPQNVLVGLDGAVKIIDFGIAKAAGKLSKTQVGTIKGKYAYMSPEQVRGLPVDARSDLFSLGICMWELATRRRLFSADNELLIMERIRYAEITPPRAVEPDVPPALEAIILKALARDVGDRYPSAAELSVALQRFAQQADQTWDRARVAEYTLRTFADGAAKPSAKAAEVAASREAPELAATRGEPARANGAGRPNAFERSSALELSMSDNKGSDLDVFEGLSSKRADTRRPSVAPPPPPSRSVPAPPGAAPRRAPTMVGLGVAPVPPPPMRSTPPIAPPPSRVPAPPPPPSSSRLPTPAPVAAPIPAPPPAAAAPVPPPPSPPAARGATVDMDWDDEDEKTHIYDNATMPANLRSPSSGPSAPATAAPAAPIPPPPAAPRNLKGTMVGLGAPLPPPPASRSSDRPLPPPSRAPGAPPAAPLPPPSAPGVKSVAPAMPPPASAPRSVPPPRSAPPAAPMPMMTPAPAPSPMASAPVDALLAAPAVEPVVPPQPMRPVADGTQIVTPKKESSSLGIIIGAVLLAVVAGGAAYLYMQSRPGNVVVNVDVKGGKDNGIVVSVDGAEKCKDSACRIEGISAGAHVVKAVIGDAETKQSITVEPGKDTRVDLKLEVAPKVSGLKVSSKQSGVKVEIDGGSAKELPVSIDDLKPGSHKLHFSGEKFRPKDLDIDVSEGATKTIDDVKLAPKAVNAKFSFVTKGAKASVTDGNKTIDLADDGKIVELDATKSWTLKATAPNFDDLSKPLDLGEDPEKTFSIELAEKGKAPPPSTTTAPVNNGGGATTTTTKPTTTTTAPATGGDGTGTLFINTLPGSNCVVNGTPRGHTPISLAVAPGPYNVTCVAKDGDDTLKKSSSATVEAGKKATVIIKLRD